MTEQKTKKLSRRDAIKLLGAAAGASVLANIPSKWSKPALAGGVLPAHAQTSCFNLVERISFTGSPSNNAIFVESLPPFVPPDTFTPNAGGPGYSSAGWDCQDGCAVFEVAVNPGAHATMTAQVTIASAQFTLQVASKGKSSYAVLVNLATGEYALDGAGTAGACRWIASPVHQITPWGE